MKICHDCPSPAGCRWLASMGVLLSCPAAEPPAAVAPARGRQAVPGQVTSRMTLLEAAELTLSHWETLGERAFDAALDVLERKVKDGDADMPLMDAAVDVLLRWEGRGAMPATLEALRVLVDQRRDTSARHEFTRLR